VSLRQALAAGERSTITTILKWVLPQAQQLEKRAFVGYYLSFPDVSDRMWPQAHPSSSAEALKHGHLGNPWVHACVLPTTSSLPRRQLSNRHCVGCCRGHPARATHTIRAL
jgi:hypothetical protein